MCSHELVFTHESHWFHGCPWWIFTVEDFDWVNDGCHDALHRDPLCLIIRRKKELQKRHVYIYIYISLYFCETCPIHLLQKHHLKKKWSSTFRSSTLCDGQTSLFGCRNVQHAHIAATENLEGHPLGPRHQRVPGVPGVGVRVARQCQAATQGTTPGVQPGQMGICLGIEVGYFYGFFDK